MCPNESWHGLGNVLNSIRKIYSKESAEKLNDSQLMQGLRVMNHGHLNDETDRIAQLILARVHSYFFSRPLQIHRNVITIIFT